MFEPEHLWVFAVTARVVVRFRFMQCRVLGYVAKIIPKSSCEGGLHSILVNAILPAKCVHARTLGRRSSEMAWL